MRWSGEVAALNEVADDDVTEEVVGMVPTAEEEWEGGGLGVTALKLFCRWKQLLNGKMPFFAVSR